MYCGGKKKCENTNKIDDNFCDWLGFVCTGELFPLNTATVEGQENLDVEEGVKVAEEKDNHSSTHGICSLKKYDDNEDECMCINHQCCGGSAKCNTNEKYCNAKGFKCTDADEHFPLGTYEIESLDCDKFNIDCKDADDIVIAVKE